jgi:YD repeat-containing protein
MEYLEIRWLPSSIGLGLYNDTSHGALITSDGRLSGSLSDGNHSVANLPVTFSGGITGATTSDSNGNYLFTPALLTSGTSYNNIIASFIDHTGSTVNSSALSFTFDNTPPTVTLTAPANANTGGFYVIVSATDNVSSLNGATVHLDVDLNNDGNFTDPGEQDYTTGTLNNGTTQFAVSPALTNGTYPLRARVYDQANNQGTSSTLTSVVNTNPTTWTAAATRRSSDVLQGLYIPIGPGNMEGASPQTGDVRMALPLDFDLSSGTSVGGNPALIYNSDTILTQPIIEATLASDPAGSVPSFIQAQLNFNGFVQPWVSFYTTGHAAGDSYALAVRASSAGIPSTGLYSWQMYVRSNFSSGGSIDRLITGSSFMVVNGSSDPYGIGWSMAGVDQLYPASGGVWWVYGTGGTRFFASAGNGQFTSPPTDAGTLVQNADGSFTYTGQDTSKKNFNSSGIQTSIVDPHGQVVTYTYSRGLLATVTAPDGGVTNLKYSNGRLALITEPGAVPLPEMIAAFAG